jgi:hypothetical protein
MHITWRERITSMQDRHKSRCLRLVAAGLFGMALYTIAARFGGPAFLARDSVHGAWLGVCIGLEAVGLVMLAKPKLHRTRV